MTSLHVQDGGTFEVDSGHHTQDVTIVADTVKVLCLEKKIVFLVNPAEKMHCENCSRNLSAVSCRSALDIFHSFAVLYKMQLWNLLFTL